MADGASEGGLSTAEGSLSLSLKAVRGNMESLTEFSASFLTASPSDARSGEI